MIALHLLSIYYIPAIYLLYTCYIPPVYLLHTCYIPDIYRIYNCYIPTVYLLYTCYIPATYLLYTCYIPTIYLRFLCSRQAHQAVMYLDRLHSLKKRGRIAFSLNLELLISFIPEPESQTLPGFHKHKSTKDRLEPHLPQVVFQSNLLVSSTGYWLFLQGG